MRRTARTSSGCWRPTEILSGRDQGSSSCSGASPASRSRSARSSTARSSSIPINVNFEHKKLFPGNIGPSTGEMGTAMFWSGPNRLFNSTLKKMEAKLARGGLRRLHRSQLHRERQRHLSARVHGALRLPDDQHPAGRHDHADRPVPGRSRRRREPKAESEERLPDRRAHRGLAVSLRRRRDLPFGVEARRDSFQERHSGGSAHRGREAGQRPVVRGRHLRRGAGGRAAWDRRCGRPRPRPTRASGTS